MIPSFAFSCIASGMRHKQENKGFKSFEEESGTEDEDSDKYVAEDISLIAYNIRKNLRTTNDFY